MALLLQGDPGIPSSIEKVFVVEMTHQDIGFTAPPSEVAQDCHDQIVDALDLADSWQDFRWTIECSWQLEQFHLRSVASERNRLRQRFQQGRFVLGAAYVSPHSGMFGEELLNRIVFPSARMAIPYGARFDTALLDDVPGFTRAMPRALSQAGVKYLLLGANSFIGGKPDIPLAHRPFWWESPGGDRVLTWLTYGSYAEGYGDWGLMNLNSAYNKLSQRLPEFEAAGYPYDAVLVMRGFDNLGPNWGMTWLARQWNQRYQNPEIIVATPAEFFEHLETKYGDVFPVYHGAASGMWGSIAQMTPATHALVRRAQAALPGVETLQAVAHGTSPEYPAEKIWNAWTRALAFLEHSGGGPGSPGMLTKPQVELQNEEFAALAVACSDGVIALKKSALALLAPEKVPLGETGIVVLNPSSDPFEGVLEVDCGGPQPADLRLVDPSGGPDPEFRWTRPDRSALAFKMDVPAIGWRRWMLSTGGSAPPPPVWTLGTVLETGPWRLELDPGLGTGVSLVDQVSGFDWLDPAAPHVFGGFESGTNLETFLGIWSGLNPSPVTVQVEEPSQVFRCARVLDRRGRLIRFYRLHEEEARLDFAAVPRISALPFTPVEDNSRHYSVSFPVRLTLPTTLEVDGPGGWYTPGADSFPGAGLGHFNHSTGARLVDAEGRWISASCLDTAVVDLGEVNGSALPSVENDETALTLKLVRHVSETEIQGGAHIPLVAEPGLPDAFPQEIRLRFGGPGSPLPGRGLLAHDLAPPLATLVAGGTGPPSGSASGTFFSLSGPATLVAFKRAERGGACVLRLRGEEPGGDVTLSLPWTPSQAWTSDLLEGPVNALASSGGVVTIPATPGATLTVLLVDP